MLRYTAMPAFALLFLLLIGAALRPTAVRADEGFDAVLANPPASGLLVIQVFGESAAEKAGIRLGDILVSYGGESLESREDLAELARAKEGKSRVEIVLVRGGKQQTVAAKGGRLGLNFVAVQKGVAIRQRAEKPYTPNLDAVRSAESWFSIEIGGQKVGFERRLITVAGDSVEVDHIVRFKFGEFNDDMRMRLTLAKGKFMPLRRIRFSAQGRELYDLARKGDMLEGMSGGKPFSLKVTADTVPSWAVDLVAETMPREEGACVRFTMLNEGALELAPGYEIYCASKDATADRTNGGKETDTWRYESGRYGSVTNRWWLTRDHRALRTEFGGPASELVSKDEALAGLPKGVSTKY